MEVSMIFKWVDFRTMLILVSVFLVAAWFLQRRRANLPPGPWTLPYIGYLPQIAWRLYRGEKLYEIATSLGYRYGKLYSIELLGQVFVVINDFAIMKEGNNNPMLSNKGHDNELAHQLSGKCMHSGKHFAEFRKFSLTSFRGFGIGKRSFESNIITESNFMFDAFNSLNGEPCNPHQYFTNTASNVLNAVVFGERFEYDDEKFKHITGLVNKVMSLFGEGGLVFALPMIPMPGNIRADLAKYNGKIFEFINEQIDQHRDTFDADNPRDFIDLCLKEMENNPKPEDPASYLQEENMRFSLEMIFFAGSDTTSTTLKWCCLYMMGYPEVQKKIQKELDSVVGRDRLPLVSDQNQLPYTRSALLEIQRHFILTPLSDFHSASEETTLRGYRIPKDANVISNFHAIFKDPDVFPEPEEFKPERFLDDRKFVEREEVCVFGVGRRRCLGEQLARMSLYIFFTHLLHRFSLVKPDDVDEVSFEGVQSATCTPKPFKMRFIQRD